MSSIPTNNALVMCADVKHYMWAVMPEQRPYTEYASVKNPTVRLHPQTAGGPEAVYAIPLRPTSPWRLDCTSAWRVRLLGGMGKGGAKGGKGIEQLTRNDWGRKKVRSLAIWKAKTLL
jgi:hypothetical protein